jgi:AcrR family transcriptional regulator
LVRLNQLGEEVTMMNEQFFELTQGKQLNIINAALEVFSKNEYKRAVTEDIAAKAGISKGLLFYYFHNKKSLYLYILDYSFNLVKGHLFDDKFQNISDFFDLTEYISNRKVEVLVRNPYIFDFIVRAYYSQNEAVTDDTNSSLQDKLAGTLPEYLSGIDYSKFRDDVNPQDIFNMLFWLTDGYMHDKRNKGQPIIMDEIITEYRKWVSLIRKSSYKDEYV